VARRPLRRFYYWPSDWIVTATSARDRRAFGFWVLVGSIVGAFFWGSEVLYVTILSVVALVPNLTSETPVEPEEKNE
jgi:hypothetical protein